MDAHCAADGPVRRAALVAATGESADSGTLGRVLKRLVDNGQVIRPKAGWYALGEPMALRAS